MRCPKCGREMQSGYVKAGEALSLSDWKTQLQWFSDEEKGKLFKWKSVYLKLKGNAHYCNVCKKVFAEFEQE